MQILRYASGAVTAVAAAVVARTENIHVARISSHLYTALALFPLSLSRSTFDARSPHKQTHGKPISHSARTTHHTCPLKVLSIWFCKFKNRLSFIRCNFCKSGHLPKSIQDRSIACATRCLPHNLFNIHYTYLNASKYTRFVV